MGSNPTLSVSLAFPLSPTNKGNYNCNGLIGKGYKSQSPGRLRHLPPFPGLDGWPWLIRLTRGRLHRPIGELIDVSLGLLGFGLAWHDPNLSRYPVTRPDSLRGTGENLGCQRSTRPIVTENPLGTWSTAG